MAVPVEYIPDMHCNPYGNDTAGIYLYVFAGFPFSDKECISRNYLFPFIFFFKVLEHLNVTTFLASSIIAVPVAGFLPFLCLLEFTWNLPNPLIRT